MVSKQRIKQVATKLNVNLDIVPVELLQVAVNVELEHGRINPRTNITNNNLLKTMKIALAHLEEYPDYYKRLLDMEKKAEKYWKNRSKPSIWKN